MALVHSPQGARALPQIIILFLLPSFGVASGSLLPPPALDSGLAEAVARAAPQPL